MLTLTAALKRQRRMGNLAEWVYQAHISFITRSSCFTSPNIGIEHDDGASEEASPHGTEGSIDHQAAPAEAGVSTKAHDELSQEVN